MVHVYLTPQNQGWTQRLSLSRDSKYGNPHHHLRISTSSSQGVGAPRSYLSNVMCYDGTGTVGRLKDQGSIDKVELSIPHERYEPKVVVPTTPHVSARRYRNNPHPIPILPAENDRPPILTLQKWKNYKNIKIKCTITITHELCALCIVFHTHTREIGESTLVL